MNSVTGAIARLILRTAACLAPRQRRGDMIAEWSAELDRDVRAGGGWSTCASAMGAFADAWALRRLDARPRAGVQADTLLTRWWHDLRLALRSLARAPGFSAVSVLTLAIGLGASAAIFTLIERVVLAPLPYPDAARLVRLENQVPGVGPDERWAMSTAQQVFFSDNARTAGPRRAVSAGRCECHDADGPRAGANRARHRQHGVAAGRAGHPGSTHLARGR